MQTLANILNFLFGRTPKLNAVLASLEKPLRDLETVVQNNTARIAKQEEQIKKLQEKNTLMTKDNDRATKVGANLRTLLAVEPAATVTATEGQDAK